MRNKNTSESGLLIPRILLALIFCAVGGMLAMYSFASTPSSGTLSPATPVLNYDAGPLLPNPSPLGLGQIDTGPRCDTAFPCDNYQLTVSLPAGYHAANPNAAAKVTLAWDNTSPTSQ